MTNFLWPSFLFLLAVIPLLIGLYIWQLRRRRRGVLRYSSLSLVRAALPPRASWRRHVPFALFLLALTSLTVALTRPVRIVSIPTNQTVILLAIDVSYSMRQNDIRPTRLDAAEDAAIAFIQKQKPGTQIGLVAFSGYAQIIHPPTTDQEALEIAVRSLTTGRRTAIGSGILRSLDAIAEVDMNVAPSISDPNLEDVPIPVPRGAYTPNIIVLLTDGVSNAGPEPLEAAQQAVDRGVRVYTIGFGTEAGGDLPFGNPRQWQGSGATGNDPSFGSDPQFGGNRGFRRGIDEETLKQIADSTGGEYYSASSADELQRIFNDLPTYLITRHEVMEISVAFAALGALLTALAMALALRWNPFP